MPRLFWIIELSCYWVYIYIIRTKPVGDDIGVACFFRGQAACCVPSPLQQFLRQGVGCQGGLAVALL